MTLETWLERAVEQVVQFAETTPCDATKIAEVEEEYRDHAAIVDALAHLLSAPYPQVAWESGDEHARFNLTFRTWVAPRTDQEIDAWSLRLWERWMQRGLGTPETYHLLGTFQEAARAHWKASRWYRQHPAPVQHYERADPEEKRKREVAFAEIFLRLYNAVEPSPLAWIPADARDRPDVRLAYEDGSLLGVEVTELVYDPVEARMTRGRATTISSGPQELSTLIEVLRERIADKVRKVADYPFEGPIALLVAVVSPLFTLEDLVPHLEAGAADLPEGIFAAVWLLGHTSAGEWSGLHLSGPQGCVLRRL